MIVADCGALASGQLDLRAYRCANPDCPSRRRGQGQVLFRGLAVVGFAAESRCHQCGWLTVVVVTPEGPEYRARPSPRT